MPTYEYACAQCGIIEVFQSMREDPLTQCPECGGKKIQRLISGGAGIIFKGDGFWETDYNRSSDYTEKASSETPSAEKKERKPDSTPKATEESPKPQLKPEKQPKKES